MTEDGTILNGRLQRREQMDGVDQNTKDHSRNMAIQFTVPGRIFVLSLQTIPEMLGWGRAVLRIHHNSANINEKAITGEALKLVKLLVANEDSTTPNNLMELLKSSSALPKNVQVIDGEHVFGRFFIDRTLPLQENLKGSFIYEDKFWTVQAHDSPFLKLAAKHIKGLSAGTDELMVSAQSFEEMAREQQQLNHRCGHDHLKFNSRHHGAPSYLAQKMGELAFFDLAQRGRMDPYLPRYRFSGAGTLSGLGRQRYTTRGCPSQRKVLHIGLVADCNYITALGGKEEKARAQIINDVALASAIFEEAYNIQLGIISIDLKPKCDARTSSTSFNVPCDADISLDERLSRFSLWRGSQTDQAGLYHLVTGCQDGSVVGIAWLHQVCQTKTLTSKEGESVSGTSVTALVKNQFSVMAHEMTHNFGGVHDCDRATCSQCEKSGGSNCQCCQCDGCDCQGQFIMDPVSGGRNVNRFSPCTIREVCDKIPVLAATCLREPGSMKIITRTQCGNGIKEEGEECDCGENCANDPCCTNECRLKPGAQCADINDRCCRQCHIIPAKEGFVCSAAQGSCQLDSRCNGKTGDCPQNAILPDGTQCNATSADQLVSDSGPLTCASGQCTSRSTQCLAVGTRLGFTGECKEAEGQCDVVCQTSQGCVALEAHFIDGTNCGWKGKCYQGQCNENLIVTYVYQYLPIFGMVVGVALFMLLIFSIKKIITCLAGRPPPATEYR